MTRFRIERRGDHGGKTDHEVIDGQARHPYETVIAVATRENAQFVADALNVYYEERADLSRKAG